MKIKLVILSAAILVGIIFTAMNESVIFSWDFYKVNQNIERTNADIHQDFLNSKEREKIIYEQVLDETIHGDAAIDKAIQELENEIEIRKQLFEKYSNLPVDMQTEPELDSAISRMENYGSILEGNWLDALNAQKYMEHNFRITLERNGCDSCPIYSVSITGDGSVLYKGLLNVKEMGKKEYTIPIDDVTELISFISDEQYRELDDQYGSSESNDSVITTIELGNTKRIVHYNDFGPELLKQIEDMVDEITKTENFLY